MNTGNFGETLMIRDVKKFFNFFTEIEPEKIDKLFEKEKNINTLKIILANEATKILHGKMLLKKLKRQLKILLWEKV